MRRGGGGLLATPKEGDKNVAVAGLLGLLGPMGWFYAAPLREAGLATAAFMLVYWLVPHLILYPLMTLLLPASALVGAAYAWKHNRSGRRSGLFTEDESA